MQGTRTEFHPAREAEVLAVLKLWSRRNPARQLVAQSVYLGILLVAGHPLAWTLGWAAAALAAYGAALLRRRQARPDEALLAGAVLAQIVHGTLVLTTGGLESPVLFLLALTPVIAAVVFGRERRTLLITSLAALWIGALLVLPEGLPGPRPRGPYDVVLAVAGVLELAAALQDHVTDIVESHRRADAEIARLREEALDDARARLHALESIGGRLAHDLKTPLSTIKCLAQLVGPAVEAEAPRRQVEVLSAEVERMSALIEDHLSFARPLVALRPAPLGLAGLVDDVLALLAGRAQLRGVAMRREGEDVGVVADRRLLRDALVSFVTNALEATPPGGSVVVGVGPAGGGARIVVRDTGRGMPAEELARVGTPYFTTRSDGTGLGVVLAQAAVRQHGGDVRFESSPGTGTKVTIALPEKPAAAPG